MKPTAAATKASASGATTAALPACTYSTTTLRLTADANGALGAVDGLTYVADERILVKDQVTTTRNGPYRVVQPGTGGTPWILERAVDGNTSASLTPAALFPIAEGTLYADKVFELNADAPVVLDTSALVFTVSTLLLSNATPVITGTAPTVAETELTSGTGFATAGQVTTTTGNFTAALNLYAGCWFIGATTPPAYIVSHPAVTGAPLVLTLYGAAPATDAGTFKILRAPTPAATNAAHTHTVS